MSLPITWHSGPSRQVQSVPDFHLIANGRQTRDSEHIYATAAQLVIAIGWTAGVGLSVRSWDRSHVVLRPTWVQVV